MRTAGLLWGSAAIRLLLVVAGGAFTDIDYVVFTDAARYVAQGESPYSRATYRYSPLLAWLLVPNVLLTPLWGKLLFSACDILVGLLVSRLVKQQGGSEAAACAAAAAWLYNPWTFTISTRGSCDVLVVLLLLWTLSCLLEGKAASAAAAYGLAVHMRIYPIIYAPSIVLGLVQRRWSAGHQPGLQIMRERAPWQPSRPVAHTWCQREAVLLSVVLHGTLFGLMSGACFLLLGWLCWRAYGQAFLDQAFLHHLSRQDHRHNFSIYFYDIYLSYAAHPPPSPGTCLQPGTCSQPWGSSQQPGHPEDPAAHPPDSPLAALPPDLAAQLPPSLQWVVALAMLLLSPRLLAFLPQVLALAVLSWRLHEELPLAWLAQTLAFVALNKVGRVRKRQRRGGGRAHCCSRGKGWGVGRRGYGRKER
ncbi:PIG-M-domain-containing protein [Haematococcus lacustris]